MHNLIIRCSTIIRPKALFSFHLFSYVNTHLSLFFVRSICIVVNAKMHSEKQIILMGAISHIEVLNKQLLLQFQKTQYFHLLSTLVTVDMHHFPLLPYKYLEAWKITSVPLFIYLLDIFVAVFHILFSFTASIMRARKFSSANAGLKSRLSESWVILLLRAQSRKLAIAGLVKILSVFLELRIEWTLPTFV